VDTPTATLDAARRAALALPRILFFAALVEVVAATLRPFFEPSATPVVLSDIAAVSRFAVALGAALAVNRLRPLATFHRVGPLAGFAVILYALAAIVPLLRFFAIVPSNITEPLWDSVLIALYGALLVFATVTTLWLCRLLALQRRHIFAARRFATAFIPLVVVLPVGLSAIDPSLMPHPAIAPAMALLTPWLLVPGRGSIMRWDIAAWVTLFLLTAGRLVTLPDTTLALPGLAIAAVAIVAALAIARPMHELGDLLSGREIDGPSATFLRRLVAGTMGGAASSRLGDLPEHSQLASDSNSDESLALAYRELGIEPKPRPAPPSPTNTANLVPFIPKSRQQSRPESEPAPSSHDWTPTRTGLHDVFVYTLAMTLIVSFGLLAGLSPMATIPVAQTLFDLILALTSLLALRGVTAMLANHPSSLTPAYASPLQVARAAFSVAFLLGLVSAISQLTFPDQVPLRFLASLLGLVALMALLVAVIRIANPFDEPRLAVRARTGIALIASLIALLASRHVLSGLDASDLQWLTWPLGLASTGVFIGLAIVLLWLFRDAEDAADRAVARRSGALAPRPPSGAPAA
jgi:hypothetical protein